jgi:5-methyltetrahydropteroyltriglutamate--homocysteine methyltransferase
VTERIAWRPGAVVRAFEFLRDNTDAVAKVTIPAPCMLHVFLGGDEGALKAGAYRDMDAFWADLVAAYKAEIAALVKAGAKYIQLDDTSIAFLCDPAHRETMGAWAKSPEALLQDYARRINETLADVPEDVTVTLHQCRGNREGQWAAEGGYDPVAEVLFNAIDVDGYFLEFDSARAGGFEPLRHLPKGKTAVLGLVSTKKPALESADDLRRRVEEAAKFAPLDQLAISPQCGFASSAAGNPLSEADERAKLQRVVEAARAIWR